MNPTAKGGKLVPGATPPGAHVEPGTQIVLTAVLESESEPVLVQTFA